MLCKHLQSHWASYARQLPLAHPSSCVTRLLLLGTRRLCRCVHNARLDAPTTPRLKPRRSSLWRTRIATQPSPTPHYATLKGDTSKCLSPLPHLLSSSSAPCPKPRTSWAFSHMPDEDRETRYYNQRTGKDERQLRLNILQTLRRRATVSRGVVPEHPRWSTYGRFSSKLALRPRRIRGSAVA